MVWILDLTTGWYFRFNFSQNILKESLILWEEFSRKSQLNRIENYLVKPELIRVDKLCS